MYKNPVFPLVNGSIMHQKQQTGDIIQQYINTKVI